MLLSRIPRKLCTSGFGYVYHRLFNTCGIQQSYIFERDYELPDGPLFTTKLEKKHHIYRVVGYQRGPPELEIILTKDSLEHGVAGEVIAVEKHVGRALIRKFEANYASPENLREVASNFAKKSGQTISGRRMLLWLRTREHLTCPMRDDVPWKLTPDLVCRALLRSHKLVVPESALELPKHTIDSSDPDTWRTHDVKITVNGADTVTLKMNIVPWNRKEIKRG